MESISDDSTVSPLMAQRLDNIMQMYRLYKNEFGTVSEGESTQDQNNELVTKVRKRRQIKVKTSARPTRRSSRISGESPKYHIDDDDLGPVPKKKKSATPRIAFHQPREMKSMEDITDDDITKIWYKSSGKTYSVGGTTCHQCRQKTLDTKSICWNKECSGVRGQFCGFCLKNRYGEDVAVALRDPNWKCPPCRGICNCSICRTRDGKRPTGILVPYVKNDGFKSVRDFLDNLETNDS